MQADVELFESKDLALFVPVLREVEFGDKFLLSMLHWCGIGRRKAPLDFWRVLLVRHGGEVVGVTGLYRPRGAQRDVLWIGWFGIRPAFRGRGIGTSVLNQISDMARELGANSLWVYTEPENEGAIRLYRRLGFASAGLAKDHSAGTSAEDTDIVFRKLL